MCRCACSLRTRRCTWRVRVCELPISAPSRRITATYQAAASEYKLEAGQKELIVPLTWTDGQGVTVTKTYQVPAGQLSHRSELRRREQFGQRLQSRFVRADRASLRARRAFVFQSRDVRLSRAGDVRRQGAIASCDIEDEEDRAFKRHITGGWMAALQHHFVAAAVPPAGATYDYQLSLDQDNDFMCCRIAARSQRCRPAASTPSMKRCSSDPSCRRSWRRPARSWSCVADYGKLTIIARAVVLAAREGVQRGRATGAGRSSSSPS